METKLGRIEGFDLLRIIASALVVLLHVSYTSLFLSKNMDVAYIAVPEFILISIFLQGYKSTLNIVVFTKRLFFRISPQYFFWTIIYLALYVFKCKLSSEEIVVNFDKIFLASWVVI